MNLTDAVTCFKTKAAIADLLKIRPQNLQKWNGEVPEGHVVELVIAAKGKLKASPEDVERWKSERDRLQRAIRLSTK